MILPTNKTKYPILIYFFLGKHVGLCQKCWWGYVGSDPHPIPKPFPTLQNVFHGNENTFFCWPFFLCPAIDHKKISAYYGDILGIVSCHKYVFMNVAQKLCSKLRCFILIGMRSRPWKRSDQKKLVKCEVLLK